MKDLEQQIKHAIRRYLERNDCTLETLEADTHFYVQLHFDEYDMALLSLELEEQFEISISCADLDSVQTVGEIVTLITDCIRFGKFEREGMGLRSTSPGPGRHYRRGLWEQILFPKDVEIIYSEYFCDRGR